MKDDELNLDSLTPEELECLYQELEAETLELARSDFAVFWNYCWPESPIATHHLEWHYLLRGGKKVPPKSGHDRVLIIAPRGWGKTSWIIRRIIWELGHNPNQFVTVVSADDSISTAILSEIARNIEHNEALHRVFPYLRRGDLWQNTRLNVSRSIVSKDFSLKASGLFSTGVSGRAHLLVFDDVVAWRTTHGLPSYREESKRIFYHVWMPQLLPNGRAISLCTPWHPHDLNMDLERSGSWAVWKRAALVNRDGEPDIHGESTWPEVWPTEQLRQKYEEDEASFLMQYLLQPTLPTELAFDLADILASCVNFAPEAIWTWPKYMGVDVGMRVEGPGSYSCIVILAVDPERDTYWGLDIYREKCTAVELVQTIRDLAQQYSIVKCYVENNAFQQALVDFLNQYGVSFEVRGFTTTMRKNDQIIGIPTMSARFKRGGWRIIHDHVADYMHCDCPRCVWIRELSEWPNCKYGDTVMATWLASRAAASDIVGYVTTEYEVPEIIVPKLSQPTVTGSALERVMARMSTDEREDEW